MILLIRIIFITYNAYETHFVFHMENGRMFDQMGYHNEKQSEFVSGNYGMTILFMLCVGRHAFLQVPFKVFQYPYSNYTIVGLRRNVVGYIYRTRHNRCMDRHVFLECLKEPRVFDKMFQDKCFTLYMDNCGYHQISEEFQQALECINTEVWFLPNNITDLVQPADSFFTHNNKEAWSKIWGAWYP